MPDSSFLDVLRIPTDTLIALDNRTLHFAMQRYHHLVRLAHVLSMAAFFGGIGLLDLRLMGVKSALKLRPFAEHVLPWLYATFAVAFVTGVALFFYDPVHVAAHAYFMPKVILICLGLVNAAMFHRIGYVAALAAESRMPRSARIAGALSLLIWTGVIVFASLNVEAEPKVILR